MVTMGLSWGERCVHPRIGGPTPRRRALGVRVAHTKNQMNHRVYDISYAVWPPYGMAGMGGWELGWPPTELYSRSRSELSLGHDRMVQEKLSVIFAQFAFTFKKALTSSPSRPLKNFWKTNRLHKLFANSSWPYSDMAAIKFVKNMPYDMIS